MAAEVGPKLSDSSGEFNQQFNNIVDEIRARSFAVRDSISTDQADELVHAYDELMREHPNPSDQFIAEHYDGQDEEVYNLPEDREPGPWNLYDTRLMVPGKPAGHTDRTLEMKVAEELGLPKKESEDPKKYYHFSTSSLEKLQKIHELNGLGPLPLELIRFHELAEPVHATGWRVIQTCLREMENTLNHPGLLNKIVPLEKRELVRNESPLRVLAYDNVDEDFMHTTKDPVTCEVIIGKRHRDKGVLTLAMAESRAGLRIEDPKGKMQHVVRKPGESAFFLADNFADLADMVVGYTEHRRDGQRILSDTVARPTYHDIVDVPGEPFSDTIGRYAIIFFLATHLQKYSTKAENHR